MNEASQTTTETFSSKAKRSSLVRHDAAGMSSSEAAWLAWYMCAVSLALAALGLFLLALSRVALPGAPVFEQWAEDAVVAVGFSTLGAIVAPRFPARNPIGWLFCAIGLVGAMLLFSGEYAAYPLQARPGSLPGGEEIAWIAATQDRLDDPEAAEKASERFGRRRMPSAARMDRFRTRLQRLVAHIDYLLAQPLGWREGTIIVWAGMRGAITLAAAQTLPEDTPSRSLLILVAFLVATSSLLLQGGTLAPLISLVKPAGVDQSVIHDERLRLMALLEQTATAVAEEHGVDLARASREGLERVEDQSDDQKRLTLAVISAQRKALLDARDNGNFSADALNAALAVLDAD